jgi:hypothetical protein
MSLEDFAKEIKKHPMGKRSFLHRNPDILEEAKTLLDEADSMGMSDTALALYMCQNYSKLQHRSHNTVRRWFKDIRLGLYE